MGEIINPYIAGAPVTEQRMFFGREDIFQWIENSITGQYADHILVVHGQRRVGKTSVLKQLGNRLSRQYIPVFFDLQGRTHTTLDRFLWWLAREIARVLKQDRDIDLPIPDKTEFSQDLEFFENRFLPDLKPVLANQTLLLTFDEFDNLEESEVKGELARPLVDYLRRLMGHANLNFIFSIGSSGRKLENMQAAYTEFFKTALYKKISFLNEEQTHRLITRPVEGVLTYDRKAVERIYSLASGHPYFTQLTCHELFARCQQTGQRAITKEDVEDVLDDVVERGTVNLKFVWDEASDIEKWSLSALAHMDRSDSRTLADFLRKNRVRFTDSDITSGLLRLREKDILTPENQFVIQLLKRWLQKNRPIEQVREELTEINPIANRYIEIGLEFKDTGLYEKAIGSFQEALEISRDNLQAQVNIALTYMAQMMHDKAVLEFEKALAIDDEDVSARAGLCEAHLALGDSAMSKGREKDAALSYQRVLAINDEHTEARWRLAEIARQRAEKALVHGRDEEALSAFAEALKYSPEDESLSTRFEEVKKERQEKVLSILLTKADKEIAAKNWESAVRVLQEGVQLSKEDERFKTKLAIAFEQQRAAKLGTLSNRALQAEQSGKWEAAVAALQEYLLIEADQPQIQSRLEQARGKLREFELRELRERARGLARSERWDESLTAWDEVLLREPADPSAQSEREAVEKSLRLAKSYAEAQSAFARKNYDKSIALFKSIVMENADYKEVTRLLAESVELRRATRKWWQSRWALGGLGVAVLLVVMLGMFRFGLPMVAAPPTSLTAGSNISTPSPPAATLAPTASPTPLPLMWTRLNSGQTFARDGISAIVFDPQDAGVMYVGTFNSGIYKSIDGGNSWQPSHNGLRHGEIYSMAIDPADPQTVYATGNITGLHISHDGGATWEFRDITGDPTFTSCIPTTISVDPNDPRHLLWSGGCTLMYHSADQGQTWEPIPSHMGEDKKCPRRANALIDPANGDIYLALEWDSPNCPGGLYVSSDRGATWKLTDPIGPWFWQNQLAVMKTDISSITFAIAGVNYENTSRDLYASTDNGASWQQPLQGCDRVAASPSGAAYATCGALYFSADGIGWSLIGQLPGGFSLQTMSISPHDPETILLGGSGLYISTDGGNNWEERNSGLPAFRLGMVVDPMDANILYAYHSGIGSEWEGYTRLYQSRDAGRTWTEIIDFGAGLSINATGQKVYRTEPESNYLWVSEDAGESWDNLAFSPGQRVDAGAGILLTTHPRNPDLLFAAIDVESAPFIYFSEDGGKTWSETSGLEMFTSALFYFSDANEEIIYAAGGWLARSENGGRTWARCPEFYYDISLGAQALAVDPRDADKIFFATLGQGVLVSEDGCQSWKPINSGLGNMFVSTIILDPQNPDTIYAGTDGGAYVSTDAGQSWGQVNDGLLGATVVYSIVVDKDGNVYAATPYGIFKLEGK